jgi:hypothetical protein
MAVTPKILQDTFNLRLAAAYNSPEYPTDRLPYLYGHLKGGSGAISYCPCIDLAAYRYMISDASIVAAPAATIYADGAVINPANYTLTSDWTDGDGRHIAVVVFTSDQSGKRIGYRGKGIKDGSGNLIENPIAVAKDLLINRLGLADADIEPTAYATAFARAAAKGYIAAGVLVDNRSMAYTLAELLGPFLGMALIGRDRRIAFHLDTGGLPPRETIAHHFDAAKLTGVRVVYDRENLINRVAMDYSPNGYQQDLQEEFQEHDDGATTMDIGSQAIHGALGPGSTAPPIQSRWIRDQATVRAIQAVMVGNWANPRFVVDMTDTCWRAAHLELRDLCGWSWPWLFDGEGNELKNQFVTLDRIRPDPRGRAVKFILRDTGYYLTREYLADGVVLADGTMMAGGERDRRDYSS